MTKPFVAILMGSESDFAVMEVAVATLKALDITYEVNVLSAHRTPAETMAYVQSADQRGCAVFIAAAGMAAHLAGFVAAHTIKPVIGVPIDSGSLHGSDALLSTVQMPGGVPVATVSIGKAGAHNAAVLAGEILALTNPDLARRLMAAREAKSQALHDANQALQKKLAS